MEEIFGHPVTMPLVLNVFITVAWMLSIQPVSTSYLNVVIPAR